MPDRAPRTTLATRMALLAVGTVVVTGLIAGFVGVGLIRSSANGQARAVLVSIAELAQEVGNSHPHRPKRAENALGKIDVRRGLIGTDGTVSSNSPIVLRALDRKQIESVLAGRDVSATRTVAGTTVWAEARPIVGGRGVIVAERAKDAEAVQDRAIRRLILALIIAGAVALILGLLVAWRLSRPLRRTAAAAHALAAGDRDVTVPVAGPLEVAEVSSAINTLAGALTHSEARQREFLLSVSHDLRTPLTAISGYAESLADGTIPPADAPGAGAVVLGEARRLERLVGDLLDLARLDSADLRIDILPTDLVELVRAAGLVWADRSSAEDVVFRLETPPHPLVVATDAARVRQVLDGLFDNALRVAPAGAPIVLAARAEPGAAVVEVRDGGPGLADADLAVAFEQGVLHRRYRGIRRVGTGLGLAIVARLVARLGGTVEAGHAPEGGARFTVRLPAGDGPSRGVAPQPVARP